MGDSAGIDVSQPSDCLVLRRDHIQCSQVDDLSVWFDCKFINTLNGPVTLQPPETWQKALYHLFNAYTPTSCKIKTRGINTGIQDGYQVELAEGIRYTASERANGIFIFKK